MAQNPDWPRDSKSADDLFPRFPITKVNDLSEAGKKKAFDGKEFKTNFVHTEPDSHFFTNIDQILETLKYPTSFDRSYLITGLENTKARGYVLIITGAKDDSRPKNTLGETVNDYLRDDYLRDDDIHQMD